MRFGLAASIICLSLAGYAATPEAAAAVRKPTNIPPQELGAALQLFAKDRNLQVVYFSGEVKQLHTQGASGELTPDEALAKLLDGTGLTYQYLDKKTITIMPPPKSGSSAGTDGGVEDVAAPEEPKSSGVPEILVKGSRVMNVDVVRTENDVQPYTIFDSTQIQRSGAANLETFLKQQLTMNTTVKTSAQEHNSFAGNTSSIDLRGLGPNETLILINGRRSANVFLGAGGTGQPDLNGIPLSLVERIEVLPSSASAIYGGAALGGVVNVVLKKNFDNSGEIGYTFDSPSHSGARTNTVSASYGMSFADGRTQIMLGGQYSDSDPLVWGDRRAILERGISTILANSPGFLFNANTPYRGATPNIAAQAALNLSAPGCFVNGVIHIEFCFVPPDLVLKSGNTPLNSPITYIPAGAAPGADITSGLLANAGTYNTNLSPGTDERGLRDMFGTTQRTRGATATLRQTITTDVQFFADVSQTVNRGRSLYNPINILQVPASSAINPFQQGVTVAVPSSLNTSYLTESETHAITAGVIAQLGDGWSSELDYTWSKNSFDQAYRNIDLTALDSALLTGAFNPFVDTIANPLDVSPYYTANSYSGSTFLRDIALRASGPVGSLPAGSPTLTIGLEHRKEGNGDAHLRIDYPMTPTENYHRVFYGQSQSTDSVYAEALIPLVSARNRIPAVYALDLQLAGRSERYSVFAGSLDVFLAPSYMIPFSSPQGLRQTIRYTSTNPTIGLRYMPVAQVTLRASYATAFLPPTVGQLLADTRLRCAGGTPCQPVFDPSNGLVYNVDYTSGGNPDLRPQTSRSLNFGLIWEPQPAVLRGLRINLEYYKITQPDYITSAPTIQQLVDDPGFASHVTRDPATGRITVVDIGPVNANEYRTSGWDLKVDYLKSTPYGTWGLHTAATRIDYDLRQSQIDSPFVSYLGYPNDGGVGKIKANGTIDWALRNLSLAWTATYYSSYWQTGAAGSPSPSTATVAAQGSSSIPSQMYHDLYGSYSFDKRSAAGWFGELLSKTTLQFGVRNLFNAKPPFDAAGAFYYSTFGDPRLRDYRLAMKVAF